MSRAYSRRDVLGMIQIAVGAAFLESCGLGVKTTFRSDVFKEEQASAPQEQLVVSPEFKIYYPDFIHLPTDLRLRELHGESRDYRIGNDPFCFEDWCRDGDTLYDYLKSRADGKIVLLNIMAYWCGLCKKEIPNLNALAQRYQDRLHVVGLHPTYGPKYKNFEDKTLDNVVKNVQNMADEHHVEFPVKLIEGSDLSRMLSRILEKVPDQKIDKFPINILVDRSGSVYHVSPEIFSREESRSFLLPDRDTLKEMTHAIEMVSRRTL